jgi:hypothetical protein
MNELLQEIHEEVQDILILKENVETFLDECPTLVEAAEEFLGKISAGIKSGKSFAGNENMAKALAGLSVLRNPDTRAAIAPEVKGINPKFTIKDVITKVGDDKEVNKVLLRIADMYAKSEVEKWANALKSIDTNEETKKTVAAAIDKMRTQYSQLRGLLTKGPQTEKPTV